jgi:hypothetical protein
MHMHNHNDNIIIILMDPLLQHKALGPAAQLRQVMEAGDARSLGRWVGVVPAPRARGGARNGVQSRSGARGLHARKAMRCVGGIPPVDLHRSCLHRWGPAHWLGRLSSWPAAEASGVRPNRAVSPQQGCFVETNKFVQAFLCVFLASLCLGGSVRTLLGERCDRVRGYPCSLGEHCGERLPPLPSAAMLILWCRSVSHGSPCTASAGG